MKYENFVELFLNDDEVEKLHDFEEECCDDFHRARDIKLMTSQEERIRRTTDRVEFISMKLDDLTQKQNVSKLSLQSLELKMKTIEDLVQNTLTAVQSLKRENFSTGPTLSDSENMMNRAESPGSSASVQPKFFIGPKASFHKNLKVQSEVSSDGRKGNGAERRIERISESSEIDFEKPSSIEIGRPPSEEVEEEETCGSIIELSSPPPPKCRLIRSSDKSSAPGNMQEMADSSSCQLRVTSDQIGRSISMPGEGPSSPRPHVTNLLSAPSASRPVSLAVPSRASVPQSPLSRHGEYTTIVDSIDTSHADTAIGAVSSSDSRYPVGVTVVEEPADIDEDCQQPTLRRAKLSVILGKIVFVS